MALAIFLDQYQIFTRNRLKMYFYGQDGLARPVRTWVTEGPESPPEISFTRRSKTLRPTNDKRHKVRVLAN